MIALLFDYLVETRGWKNGVAKIVATTNLINALAEHHKMELYETPVGFKYIGELIKQDKIAIGGEESAGFRSGIMSRRRMGCWPGCCAARWSPPGANPWEAIEGIVCQSWFLLSVAGKLPLDG